jgi:uncharacterized glyoxalase superfamily protein PhnB
MPRFPARPRSLCTWKWQTPSDAVARATVAGARLERLVADYPYGQIGVLRDPFGHRWMVRSGSGVG